MELARHSNTIGIIYFLLGFLNKRYIAIEARKMEATNDGIK